MFCSRYGRSCGTLSGIDNCAMPRNNVACGTCDDTQMCVNDTICTALTVCGDNQYVSVQPTVTSDRECAPCPMGSSSMGPNANACLDACDMALGISCAQFEEAYIKASNTNEYHFFGHSVALNGNTLAVGAYLEASSSTGVNGNQTNSNAEYSGAVYVFTRVGSSWTQQAYIKASNTDSEDFFGIAVSLFGDTLAVGAGGESSAATGINGNQLDNSATGSGAVYVFTRSGSTWSQQAYIKASNTEAEDGFGRSLSLGADTLAVSAIWEDSSASGLNGDQNNNDALQSGAVYVFTRSGTTWSQQAYIKASNPGADDLFGLSLQLSGDTLAVGAPYEDSSSSGVNGAQNNLASNSGAVYVFTRSGSIWSQQAFIKASNTGANDLFGYGLTLDGDTLVVGAPREDSGATGIGGDQASNAVFDAGAAYVFVRSGSNWSQQAYLKASNTGTNDRFGESVSLSGDFLAIAAAWEDSNATGLNGNQLSNSDADSGAVYVFRRSGNQWSQLAYIKASNTDPNDYFGRAIALDSNRLAIGAFWEDSAATGVNGDQTSNAMTNSGAVYIRRLSP